MGKVGSSAGSTTATRNGLVSGTDLFSVIYQPGIDLAQQSPFALIPTFFMTDGSDPSNDGVFRT